MFKIKAADGTNNICGRRIAEIHKSKKLSQRKLAALDVSINDMLSAEDAKL